METITTPLENYILLWFWCNIRRLPALPYSLGKTERARPKRKWLTDKSNLIDMDSKEREVQFQNSWNRMGIHFSIESKCVSFHEWEKMLLLLFARTMTMPVMSRTDFEGRWFDPSPSCNWDCVSKFMGWGRKCDMFYLESMAERATKIPWWHPYLKSRLHVYEHRKKLMDRFIANILSAPKGERTLKEENERQSASSRKSGHRWVNEIILCFLTHWTMPIGCDPEPSIPSDKIDWSPSSQSHLKLPLQPNESHEAQWAYNDRG
jgi:hypothetical protein